MVELKYTGTHQPQGMIVDVEDSKKLLDSGDYEEISTTKIVEKIKEKPTKKWKEIKIYDWIKENNISIDYVPSRDKKDDVLKELKDGGFLNDNSK